RGGKGGADRDARATEPERASAWRSGGDAGRLRWDDRYHDRRRRSESGVTTDLEKKERRAGPWTDELWVYDLRTNMHFTLKQKPIQRSDFDNFGGRHKPGRMHERQPTWSEANPEGRWRLYSYEELTKRDKLSLDLFWIKDKSLTDIDSLPAPDVIAAEIVDDS